MLGRPLGGPGPPGSEAGAGSETRGLCGKGEGATAGFSALARSLGAFNLRLRPPVSDPASASGSAPSLSLFTQGCAAFYRLQPRPSIVGSAYTPVPPPSLGLASFSPSPSAPRLPRLHPSPAPQTSDGLQAPSGGVCLTILLSFLH